MSVLFLLPSIGVHFDLSYCCGNLEEVGMLHSYTIEVDDCPVVLEAGECMAEVEIISEPTYLDFLNAVDFEFPTLTVEPLDFNPAGFLDYHVIQANPFNTRPPPKQVKKQVLFQSFLC